MRALLVPVKSFRTAKLRLAPVLNAGERAELARSLAAGVLRAGGSLSRNVVCDDEDVADWARAAGARVIWTPGLGLSGAVEAGVATLAAEDVSLVVVAHSDLPLAGSPLAGSLEALGQPGRVTLVPDLRADGTNVAVVPAGAGFRFSYGPGSFGRHRAEAARLGLLCDILHDASLAADVDVPADLAHVGSAELDRIRHPAAP